MPERPLILLDVDGVLNPFAASRRWLDASTYRRHLITAADGHTYTLWLDRSHGRDLRSLRHDTGAEPAWCTTWEHEANDRIARLVGLPKLPVVEFPAVRDFESRWKFQAVLEFADDRPLVWFDDDFQLHQELRDEFLGDRGDRPTLLHPVEATKGLVAADFEAVRSWLTK